LRRGFVIDIKKILQVIISGGRGLSIDVPTASENI
jgi:hypothetical protein